MRAAAARLGSVCDALGSCNHELASILCTLLSAGQKKNDDNLSRVPAAGDKHNEILCRIPAAGVKHDENLCRVASAGDKYDEKRLLLCCCCSSTDFNAHCAGN